MKNEKILGERIDNKRFSNREVSAILSVADRYEELIVRILIDTGLETGKLAEITPEDLNYNSGDKNLADIKKHEREFDLSEETINCIRHYIEYKNISQNESILGDKRDIRNTIKDLLTFSHVKIGENFLSGASPRWFRYNKAMKLKEEGLSRKEVQRWFNSDKSRESMYFDSD